MSRVIAPGDARALTRALVEIDSRNPSLAAGAPGEAPCAAFLHGVLDAWGFRTELRDAVPGRPNVIARVGDTRGGRSLMFNGHLDVVGIEGMVHSPFGAAERDGRLYGRGAADMKGGIGAMCAAAYLAARDGVAGEIVIAAVADEEYESLGTRALVEQGVRADACIVTEPTHLRACIAHRGFVWAQLQTQGRAAHGSRPDLGVDAIVGMAPVLAGIPALQRRLEARPHPLLGAASLHASLIAGGQELSSYPERCVLDVERRTLPGESAQDVERELQELLALAGEADPRLDTGLRMGLVREPFEVDPSADIVRTVRAAAARTLGAEPEIVGHSAWMDAAFLSAAGMPTVVFGPTGEGAHAIEEHVELESVEQVAEIVIETARRFCA
jgi:acetylornithine deacetylase